MKEKKYFIDTVIEKEKQRNENMRSAYEKRMSDLPRGSLFIRNINGKKYCYLRYREGKKVVQKYAGTIQQEKTIRNQIAEREHLTDLISMLEEERKRIIKMEAIK